jgi:hypothetical protein
VNAEQLVSRRTFLSSVMAVAGVTTGCLDQDSDDTFENITGRPKSEYCRTSEDSDTSTDRDWFFIQNDADKPMSYTLIFDFDLVTPDPENTTDQDQDRIKKEIEGTIPPGETEVIKFLDSEEIRSVEDRLHKEEWSFIWEGGRQNSYYVFSENDGYLIVISESGSFSRSILCYD